MSQLQQLILQQLELLEQKAGVTLYDITQIEDSIGYATFREGFYQTLNLDELGGETSLENAILNMERRQNFRDVRTTSVLQLQVFGDILSLRRITQVAGKSASELSVDELENQLVRYITGDEEITQTYARLRIEPDEWGRFQNVLRDDTFTLLGILEAKEKEITLEYVRDVIKNRLPEFFDPAIGITHAVLDGWYEFERKQEEGLAEKIYAMVRMCEFDSLRKKIREYRQGIELIASRIIKAPPMYIRTIECDSHPLAIRFSPTGELVVFDFDQMVRRYNIDSGEKVGEVKTRLESGVRGTALGPDTFYGGLFVDKNDIAFVYAFGVMQRIGKFQTGESGVTLPIPFSKDMIGVNGNAEFGDNIVGVTQSKNKYCVLIFHRGDTLIRLEMYNDYGHTTYNAPLHHGFTISNAGEDESPRIQSYGNKLYIATGKRLYAMDTDSGTTYEIKFDDANQDRFAPTKFDFAKDGTLWILNMLQAERFPSIKGYRLIDNGDGYSTQLETFFPLKEIDFQSGFRDIAIDREGNILAVSDMPRKTVDLYSLSAMLSE